MPYTPIYGTAKAGCVQLVRSLAQPLARKGIRIGAVCPEFTNTPLVIHLVLGRTCLVLLCVQSPSRTPAWAAVVRCSSVCACACQLKELGLACLHSLGVHFGPHCSWAVLFSILVHWQLRLARGAHT